MVQMLFQNPGLESGFLKGTNRSESTLVTFG